MFHHDINLFVLYDPSKTINGIKSFENVLIEFHKFQHFGSFNVQPNYGI